MPWGSTISRAFCSRGFVFAGPAFQGHTQVLDHVSRMLIAIFGDHGQHARSAVGVAGLPLGRHAGNRGRGGCGCRL
jgi:enamine deaminase RidA (YjgF/YER057c/UK114 family)